MRGEFDAGCNCSNNKAELSPKLRSEPKLTKPSIAELLQASGYSVFSGALIGRAIAALDGNLGINRDERNWDQILATANPLAAAEAALSAQWKDPSYLLRNAQFLADGGTIASTIELTYRQMAQRLSFTYNPSWARGTTFETLSTASDAELSGQVTADVDAHTPASVRLLSGAEGASFSLSHAGQLSYSVSGADGSASAGNTALNVSSNTREGQLTVVRDNGQATTTATFLFIGTNTPASPNYLSGPTLNRLIILGGANDSVDAGQGNDTIYGGAGNDIIYTNQANDLVYGQDGNDFIQSGQGNDIINGGSGDDIIYGGSSGIDELTGGTGADQFRFSIECGADAVKDFSLADGDTIALYDGIDASPEVHFAAAAPRPGPATASLSASDFDTVSSIADVLSSTGGAGLGNNQLYVVTNAQTSSQIAAGVPGGATSAYVLAFNSTTNAASLYYDSDWSTSADRTELATFSGLSLADIQTMTISNFFVWA